MTNAVLIDAVPGNAHIDITREFDAAVDAVFRAHADPKLFVQWIGPRALQTTLTSWDFRTSGNYAYEQRDADGNVYTFRGVIHTVDDDSLLIQTFEYLGAPGEVSLDRFRFEPLPDGRSRIIARAVFPSVETRDRMLAEGMEHGVDEGYQKLDDLLNGR